MTYRRQLRMMKGKRAKKPLKPKKARKYTHKRKVIRNSKKLGKKA